MPTPARRRRQDRSSGTTGRLRRRVPGHAAAGPAGCGRVRGPAALVPAGLGHAAGCGGARSGWSRRTGAGGTSRRAAHGLTRDAAFRDEASSLVKQPVEWAVGLMRALGVRPSAAEAPAQKKLAATLRGLGQLPFLPAERRRLAGRRRVADHRRRPVPGGGRRGWSRPRPTLPSEVTGSQRPEPVRGDSAAARRRPRSPPAPPRPSPRSPTGRPLAVARGRRAPPSTSSPR